MRACVCVVEFQTLYNELLLDVAELQQQQPEQQDHYHQHQQQQELFSAAVIEAVASHGAWQREQQQPGVLPAVAAVQRCVVRTHAASFAAAAPTRPTRCARCGGT